MLPILLILFAPFIAVFVYLGIKSYRSPIKHIPEPPGAWPLVGHSPSFFRTSDHLALHEKWTKDFKEHGMYRIRHPAFGMEFVMITKPEWAKHILSRPEDFKRDDFFITFFPKLGEGLLTSNGDPHRFQKKILAKSFSIHHVKKYLPVFDKHVKVLVQLWKSKTQYKAEGENIEVRKYTNNLSFDIITNVAFGYQADSQINEDTRFVKSFRESVEAMANFKKRTLKHLFPFLRFLPFGLDKLLDYEVDKILDKLLASRRQKILKNELSDFEKNDLLSNMVESTDESTGKSFSDKIIKDNCITFLFAGFETVSTAIPIVLYHLCQYPEMQEKVRQEIQTVFESMEDEMAIEKFDSLRFTDAFIRESLRFFPTTPLNGRETTRSCKFGDYHIPQKTLLLMLADHSNRDPAIFDFPDEFIPERYLEGSSIKSGPTLSFGYGPYNCIGKHFAMQEIKLTITRLLQHFKFSMDTENNKKFSRMPVIAVRIDPPFKIRVQRLD